MTRADRPPGRDAGSGPRPVPGSRLHVSTPPSRQGAEVLASSVLPYDQIPEERRTIGDATGRLDGHNGVLGVALAQWMARDDSRPQADARRAGSTAMDTIDAMLAELHTLRARLLGEIRVSDRLAADRADALLARLRGEPL